MGDEEGHRAGVTLAEHRKIPEMVKMRRLLGLMSWVFASLVCTGGAFALPSTDLDSYVLFATGEGLSDNTAPLTYKGGNDAGTGYVWG